MYNSNRKSGYDWIIIGIYISLLIIGWFAIYAATYSYNVEVDFLDASVPITKQTIYVVVAVSVFLSSLYINSKFWHTFAYIFYGIGIFLLFLVLIFGSEIKGAKAWFVFGGFSFQPAEIAKFGTALALSSFLSYFKVNLKTTSYLWISVFIIFTPIFFILLQPDAGSALTFFSFFILLFIEGFSPLFYLAFILCIIVFITTFIFPLIFVIFSLLIVAIIFSWFYFKSFKFQWPLLIISIITILTVFILYNQILGLGIAIGVLLLSLILLWKGRQEKLVFIMPIGIIGLCLFAISSIKLFEGLEAHQQERIKVWLKPEECDPRGSLYNVLQSKVAIGSGGFFGRGFMNGNMTKLKFVPEQSTDFIFSTIGEEQGFVGSSIVILLYILLIWRILQRSEQESNKFISHFGICLAGLIFIHVLINIGMTLGLMPIIGIPLPFISKGGSSLIGFSLMLGVFIRMQTK